MFTKKAKKLEVKSEMPHEHKINIEVEVRPLVRIEKHESRINGKVQEPKYRVSIADREVITLSSREFHELFVEMLALKEDGELIHDIAETHMRKHQSVVDFMGNIEEMVNQSGLGDFLKELNKK